MRNLLLLIALIIPMFCMGQGEFPKRQDLLGGVQVGDSAAGSLIRTADSITRYNDVIVVHSAGVDSILLRNWVVPPHGAFHFHDSSTTLTMSTGVWTTITNAWNTLWTTMDADDMTFAGDSITITEAGSYISMVSLSFSGTAADLYEMAIFKNAAILHHIVERSTSQTDVGNIGLPSYLENLVAGDDLTLKIRNTASNDDATVISCSWVIYRLYKNLE